MNKVIGFAMSLAVVCLTLWMAYNFPTFTIGVLDGLVLAVKGISYPFPAAYGAMLQVALRFLLPAFIFMSLVLSLTYGARLTAKGALFAYKRWQKRRGESL